MRKLLAIMSKIMIKIKKNNFYAWEISQKLFVDCLKWVEDTSQVNKDFIKKQQ